MFVAPPIEHLTVGERLWGRHHAGLLLIIVILLRRAPKLVRAPEYVFTDVVQVLAHIFYSRSFTTARACVRWWHVDHADSGGASDARVSQGSFVAQASAPEDQSSLCDGAPGGRTEARQQGANPAARSGFHCVAQRFARNGFVKFHVDQTGYHALAEFSEARDGRGAFGFLHGPLELAFEVLQELRLD